MIEALWLLVIGALLLFLGYSKKAGSYNKPATWIGLGMILVGAFWPAYGVWSDQFSFDVITTSAAGIDVVVANGTSYASGGSETPGTVAEDGKTLNLQFTTRAANDMLYTNYSAANYTVRAIAPAGVSNDNLVAITFSAPETLTYGGEDVFAKTGSEYACDWVYTIGSAAQVATTKTSGTINMLYTDTLQIQLRIQWSTGANGLPSEFDAVGDQFTVPVTINDQVYNINCIVITAN